jgi:hypothetical protein
MSGGRAALALLVVLSPLPARAYRPFNSTDAAVADRGRVEIELGPIGLLEEGPDRFVVAPSVIFNWGIVERCELVLEGRQFVRLGSNAAGEPRLRVDDNALSLKTVVREGVLQEKSGPSVAAELGALLPAIHGEGGAGVELAAIASQRWEALTMHLNGAASWTRAHAPGWFGGLIAELHDAWTVRPVTEVFVESERGLPVTVSWLGGAIWRLQDDFSLDAALRLARSGGANTTEIRAGLTWQFGVGGSHDRNDLARRLAPRRR